MSYFQPQHPTGAVEPLYVNAKQYHRIVKRREARARYELLHQARLREKVFRV